MEKTDSPELARQIENQLADKTENQRQFLLQVIAIHETLLDTLDYEVMTKISDQPDEQRIYLQQEISKILHKQKIEIAGKERDQLIDAVINEVIGFGPIEPLLQDPNVTDIFVNSPNKVFIEKKGKVVKSPVTFLDDEHVFRLAQRVASKSGRHLDLGTPYLDAQLPDGSRLHAIIPPIAMEGVKLSIRKFLFKKLDLERLVEGGSMTSSMANLLHLAVRARFNVVICGGTGSGKTTLLNSLLDSIRSGERVITLEDTPELEPTHAHTIRLITRAPNPEGKGAVTQEHLMINALRMRPDRVILGEMRGSEAFNLLHAMNTGQDGSMATLHASGTEEVLSRLLNMILMARYSLSVESVLHQIAGALDLIVYVARLVDGSRRVMSIAQVSSGPKGELQVQDLFNYQIEHISEDELKGSFNKFNPPISKRCLNKLMTSGLIKEYKAIFSDMEESADDRV